MLGLIISYHEFLTGFLIAVKKNMAEIKKTQLYSETILYRMGHTYFWFEFTFKILMVIKKYVYIKSIYVLRFRRYSDNKRFI